MLLNLGTNFQNTYFSPRRQKQNFLFLWSSQSLLSLVEISLVRKRKKPSVSSFFLAKNDKSPYNFSVSIVVFVLNERKKESVSSFLDAVKIRYRRFFIASEIGYRRLLNVKASVSSVFKRKKASVLSVFKRKKESVSSFSNVRKHQCRRWRHT